MPKVNRIAWSSAVVAFLLWGCAGGGGGRTNDEDRDGDGGSGGAAGDDSRGTGGDGTDRAGAGGDAGNSAGGRGASTGGTGGTSAKGGSGGTSSAAGSGGSNTGGVAVCASPAIADGPGIFFSGKETSLRKLNDSDAEPGYAYVRPLAQSERTLASAVEVNDPVLPAGTKYALYVEGKPVVGQTWFFTWNWRADKSEREWNYYDASAFAGIEMWTKASESTFLVMNIYEAANFPMNPVGDFVGDCAQSSREQCKPSSFKLVMMKDTWQRVRIAFKGGLNGPPEGVDASRLGRGDLQHSTRDGAVFKLWVTGWRFLTAAELAAEPKCVAM